MKTRVMRTFILLLALLMAFTSAAEAFTYSSSVEKKLFSVSELKDYKKPTTPAFDEDKGWSSFTTVKERSRYLDNLSEKCPYIHVFTKENLSDVPVVFFSSEDMSGAEDWKDAADVFTSSGKINVMYHAQLHGDEPAGGEGALYLLQRIAGDEEYAAYLAEHLNICVIPCGNPDAARIKSREDSNGDNVNADNLFVKSKYTRWLHDLYHAIYPEVVMDSHECVSNMQLAPNKPTDYFTDVYFAGTSSLNIDHRLNEWSSYLVEKAMSRCKSAGLRVSLYDNSLTSVNNVASRNYYGLGGSVSILIESMGVNMGKSHFNRRVYSHYRAADSILRNVIKNKEALASDIAAVRSELAGQGKKFSSDNRFVLEQGISENEYTTVSRNIYNSTSGKKVSSVKYKIYWHDEIIRSRALPTAYVISKKTKNADKAIKKLRYNGVEYFEIEPGTKIKVSSFSGDGTKATLTKARDLTFSKGAYVIPMDQPMSRIIAACLEPDVYETLDYKGTFVQSGLLKASQIYRYTKSNPREKLGPEPEEQPAPEQQPGSEDPAPEVSAEIFITE